MKDRTTRASSYAYASLVQFLFFILSFMIIMMGLNGFLGFLGGMFLVYLMIGAFIGSVVSAVVSVAIKKNRLGWIMCVIIGLFISLAIYDKMGY